MPDKKNLLVICQGYPPFYGGAEHVAGELAVAAARGAYNVHVLTSDIGSRLPAYEETAGVKIMRVPCRKKKWGNHSVPELLAFYTSACKHIKTIQSEIKPDYILAHFTMPAGLIAHKWNRKYGLPYAVVMHGADVPGHEPGRFRFLHSIMRYVARKVWRGADRLIAVSEDLADKARKVYPSGRIAVIPNGVDTDRFTPAPARSAAQRPLRIAVVSRLIEIKGIRFLLQAASNLETDIHIDIYGDGSQRSYLANMANKNGLKDKVTFHGVIEANRMPTVLRRADIFVLPSLEEGLPLSLLEAMASGLAVIATSVGEIPSVLTNGRNGLLIAPGNADELRQALNALTRDAELLRNLGFNARATAEEYAWPGIWRKYVETIWGLDGCA